jgi:hypothetical protein
VAIGILHTTIEVFSRNELMSVLRPCNMVVSTMGGVWKPAACCGLGAAIQHCTWHHGLP